MAKLPILLDRLARDADSVFGQGKWRFFMASDSPGVKEYALQYMIEEKGAKSGLSVVGKTGHTNLDDTRSTSDAYSIGQASLADLIALSECDMFVNNQYSRYSLAARSRAVCPQRYLEIGSRIFYHTYDIVKKLITLAACEKCDKDKNNNYVKEILTALVPPHNPCLQYEDPVHACACYYYIAYK
jgi:hypothetical protein